VSAAENAYAAADTWRDLAEAALDALAEAGRVAQPLMLNNSGAAIDAFEQAWHAVSAPECDGALPRLVDACRDLAERCDEYAARLSTASD
jgi:hypothetical protein